MLATRYSAIALLSALAPAAAFLPSAPGGLAAHHAIFSQRYGTLVPSIALPGDNRAAPTAESQGRRHGTLRQVIQSAPILALF